MEARIRGARCGERKRAEVRTSRPVEWVIVAGVCLLFHLPFLSQAFAVAFRGCGLVMGEAGA